MAIAKGTFNFPFTKEAKDKMIDEAEDRLVEGQLSSVYIRHLITKSRIGDSIPREEWHRLREFAREIPMSQQDLKSDMFRLLKFVQVEDTE